MDDMPCFWPEKEGSERVAGAGCLCLLNKSTTVSPTAVFTLQAPRQRRKPTRRDPSLPGTHRQHTPDREAAATFFFHGEGRRHASDCQSKLASSPVCTSSALPLPRRHRAASSAFSSLRLLRPVHLPGVNWCDFNPADCVRFVWW